MKKLVLLLLFLLPLVAFAKWPDQFPFVDECRPMARTLCRPSQGKGQCVWNTTQYPICTDARYARVQPRNPLSVNDVGIATRFFKFSWGVHLSEGSNQQWIYNLDVEQCASRCLLSASEENEEFGRIRCLSFDFYPHETPKTGLPWNETIAKGMCVLNSENRDTARIRNEDLGYSDAELFYKSHFTNRPFSDLDGYYEIRDPRGSIFSSTLEYDSPTPELNLISVWGKSRWGILFFEGPIRKPPVTKRMCLESADDTPRDPVKFLAGFTPIDDYQKCTGMNTKKEAEAFCKAASGDLCSSKPRKSSETGEIYNPIDFMYGKKIGCGYDGQDTGVGEERFEIWSKESPEFQGPPGNRQPRKAFTRCCTEFGVVVDCLTYQKEHIDFCKSKKTASECVLDGSGKNQQAEFGFGTFLDKIREDCQRFPSTRCTGSISRDWFTRDRCVFCVEPGFGISGGKGTCRPGGDLGICPTATERARSMFAIKAKRLCGGTRTICPLVGAFPDLEWLYDPPGSENNSTNTPTASTSFCQSFKSRATCPKTACSWIKKKKSCIAIL